MRRDLAAVCDIIHSATIVTGYTDGRTFDDFRHDQELQDAVVFRMLIIGEAARRISPAFQQRYPNVPWAHARGMRNRIIHEYDRIHLQTVWDTVRDDLPPFVASLQAILDENPPE